MEFRVLPNPLCMEPSAESEDQGSIGKNLLLGLAQLSASSQIICESIV